MGWAGPPGLKLGSPGAWRDPASSAVRRSHSRLRPRAGGTGRPHGQSPTAVTAAVERYPYGKDPHDSNIRIAPSFPTVEELEVATYIFALSVKLVSVNKLLSQKA